MTRPDLNLRWTIGDVSAEGFEALRLSLHGALRLFGRGARYHVCVNSLEPDDVKRRAGPLPEDLVWHTIERRIPEPLAPFLDAGMTEGSGWKFIPLQIDPNVRELALDNDVILWAMPDALQRWLDAPADSARLIAADVTPAHGQFAHLCGPEPRNSGLRGTPAGFDFGAALAAVLREHPVTLRSELDEQGLQIAALRRDAEPFVVPTQDVSICSPFPPHMPDLGRCGAHFVGLNAKTLPWTYYDRPAREVRLEHWHRLRPEVYARLGLDPPDPGAPGVSAAAAAC